MKNMPCIISTCDPYAKTWLAPAWSPGCPLSKVLTSHWSDLMRIFMIVYVWNLSLHRFVWNNLAAASKPGWSKMNGTKAVISVCMYVSLQSHDVAVHLYLTLTSSFDAGDIMTPCWWSDLCKKSHMVLHTSSFLQPVNAHINPPYSSNKLMFHLFSKWWQNGKFVW